MRQLPIVWLCAVGALHVSGYSTSPPLSSRRVASGQSQYSSTLHALLPTSSSSSTEDIKADIARLKEEAQRRIDALTKQMEDYNREHPHTPATSSSTTVKKQEPIRTPVTTGMTRTAESTLSSSTNGSTHKESSMKTEATHTQSTVTSTTNTTTQSPESLSRDSMEGLILDSEDLIEELPATTSPLSEKNEKLEVKNKISSDIEPRRRVIDLTYGTPQPTRYDLLDDTRVRISCICIQYTTLSRRRP
jgi:hypothetical protein